MDNLGTPLSKVDTKYDAIIIGAGIGGLVCGCYLAKKGLKVLIVEQHYKPGGYCSSFEREGCIFDATVHSLSSFRNKGQLRTVYDELELEKYLKILRFDPVNFIVFPKHSIKIYNDIKKTLYEFQENFPDETRSLTTFFNYISTANFTDIYVTLKDKTLLEFLKNYFKDSKLISTLCSVLINAGFPSYEASALSTFYHYKEFMFDSGYYPKGGMQRLPDSLAKSFGEIGGRIIFSNAVKKIKVENKKVKSVILKNGEEFISEIIISNCDSYQTFFDFIGKEYISKNKILDLRSLKPTPSALIIYLALKSKSDKVTGPANIWYFDDYNIDNVFSEINIGKIDIASNIIFCGKPSSHDTELAPPGLKTMFLISLVPYKDFGFWEEKSEIISERMVKKMCEILGVKTTDIATKEIATPLTLHKYTRNYKGSSFGLGATPPQIRRDVLPQRCPFLKGLYLVGHWSTGGAGQGGVSFSAASGRNLAKLIMKDIEETINI